jgi:hypothetical protein
MPRYFFHLTDGKRVEKGDKPQGIELAGNAAAREEALMLARDLKHGKLMPERKWDGWFVRIVDGHGNQVDTVPIADAPEAS